MTSTDQIEAPARILEVLAHGGYRAQLRNGHVCVARPLSQVGRIFAVGDQVRLAFHPADLSRARVLGAAELTFNP